MLGKCTDTLQGVPSVLLGVGVDRYQPGKWVSYNSKLKVTLPK